MDFDERNRLVDESSMLNWYPKVAGYIEHMPETHLFKLTKGEIMMLYRTMDNKPISKKFMETCNDYAEITGYPLFLRTDQSSCKHDFEDTCFVEHDDGLEDHIRNLVMGHACADFLGIKFGALVFREFIKLEHSFTAFRYMPVAKERRYFVRDGKVECSHPYWPLDAIHSYGDPLPENWQDQLVELNRQDPDEIDELTPIAETFGKYNPGYWSVDFAKGADGIWYLIDAARGEVSWHDNECPFNLRKEPDRIKLDDAAYEAMFAIKEDEPYEP